MGYLNEGAKAFVTEANGANMIELLGGPHTAFGINDSGQVTGHNRSNHAFITDTNGTGITDLGTLGGTSSSYSTGYSVGSAINNSGQVAGYSYVDSNYSTHAFITGSNGVGMTDLGTLGGRESYATDINDSGQVVGYSNPLRSGILHAFITGPNGIGMTDLGTLGGYYSYATGINNSGQVTGFSEDTSNNYIAFITDTNGTNMTSIGTLGGARSWANDINDSGQIVGWSDTATERAHPFLYSDGVMINLMQLAPVIEAGWDWIQPEAINNLGQIVGHGSLNGSDRQAFLLSPFDIPEFPIIGPPPLLPIPSVPEPSTYTLLLVGLGLLFFRTKTELNS
ncbi:DUF3466 family protein [Nitrosomonas sp. Is35]|uniref:DUF3466 family protein n=1 Tax=Nitrosomonas sp. Is35 TaxID=3080534 RepID=UPI00294B35D6|nr:DUF3466 family protein [Nitrosomonas sp. Is35]MDV6346962.1 DUF3466 family protein [Nitrosomonas sp. Is35]